MPKPTSPWPAIVSIAALVFILYFGFPALKSLFSSPSSTPQMAAPAPATPDQILQDLQSAGMDCTPLDPFPSSASACRVDQISGDFAKGLMPQAYWIAVNTGGRWQMVVSGNGLPDCFDIDRHSIPTDIYGNCIETSGELRFPQP